LAPLPSNFVQVPVVRQRRGFSCGPAAVLCLLRHYCREAYATVEEEALYGPLETSESRGTEPEPMVRLFAQRGIDASYRHGDVTVADLERAVDGGMLPIVDLQAWRDGDTPWSETWDAGHYVIMVGYDAERLFFADPSTMTPEGYAYLLRGELEERWHDLAGDKDVQLRRMAVLLHGPRGRRTWPGDAAPPQRVVRLG
jgi:predicted double-glycine peptidase